MSKDMDKTKRRSATRYNFFNRCNRNKLPAVVVLPWHRHRKSLKEIFIQIKKYYLFSSFLFILIIIYCAWFIVSIDAVKSLVVDAWERSAGVPIFTSSSSCS